MLRRGSTEGGSDVACRAFHDQHNIHTARWIPTFARCIRAPAALSLLSFRHSIIVSIGGLGLWRAMWPSADMSWSKLGSTPGPQTSSTLASGWPRSVMHWLIFESAWLMNWPFHISFGLQRRHGTLTELNRWCRAYSPTVFSSLWCWW